MAMAMASILCKTLPSQDSSPLPRPSLFSPLPRYRCRSLSQPVGENPPSLESVVACRISFFPFRHFSLLPSACAGREGKRKIRYGRLQPLHIEQRQVLNGPKQCKIAHIFRAICLGVMLALVSWKIPRCLVSSSAFAATTEILIKRPSTGIKQRRPSIEEKVVYALDYFFATEPAGKAFILLVICVMMTAVGGLLYYCASTEEDEGAVLSESVWAAWTFVADPGTHAEEAGLGRRLIAVPLTIGGMLFFALLVGLMTDAVGNKMDQLQKGESMVIEENHTLIVGWTPKTLPLVKELTIANKSRGQKRSIVILGENEKEEMDEELRRLLPLEERFGSKVVTRTGVATSAEDLQLCSASMARSIIVLSPSGLESQWADAKVMQNCLMLTYMPDLRADIVAELVILENVEVLKSILQTFLISEHVASPKENNTAQTSKSSVMNTAFERQTKVVPVATGDVVLRMLVERALQPGIVDVANELLAFDGCEFRFKYWPELVGKTFGEIVYLFKDAIPCGIRKAKPTKEGDFTLLNPPPETVLEVGDKLLVISEDDDSYSPGHSHAPSSLTSIPPLSQNRNQNRLKPVLNILIAGWQSNLRGVLQLLDCSVAKGSQVTILSNAWKNTQNKEIRSTQYFEHIRVHYRSGDPLSVCALKSLPIESYDKVIIIADESGMETESYADKANTIAMLVRYLQISKGTKDAMILAELPMTTKNSAFRQIQEKWLNDSVFPDQLQAMVLAHLAEDADVGSVLDEILSEDGSTLLLLDITIYAEDGEVLTFWDLQSRSLEQGELIIAYKSNSNGSRWVLNPKHKNKKLEWIKGDQVIVLTQARKH